MTSRNPPLKLTVGVTKYDKYIWALPNTQPNVFGTRKTIWNVVSAWFSGKFGTMQEAEEAFELATLALGNKDMEKFVTPGWEEGVESSSGSPPGGSGGGGGRDGDGGGGDSGGGLPYGEEGGGRAGFVRGAKKLLLAAREEKWLDAATFDFIMERTILAGRR